MLCSEARLAANRANALKSTGPKTGEGREASRRNALKHGLTGAGVVVPGEDAEEIKSQAAALLAELAPDGLPTARLLAGRVATLAVRLKRSERHEEATTAERAHRAALDFDEVRRAEADRLFDAIDEANNRADLLTMPEGVDLLDAALAELHAVAAAGAAGWSRGRSDRLVRCLSPEARAHAEALGKALVDGDLSGIDRGPSALDQVIGLIDAERAGLGSLRPTLDHATIARLRADAVGLVLVDDEPATLRARRYEAASSRELYRALREVREFRKRAAAPPAAEPPASFPPTAELVRQADAMQRPMARVEPARVAAATPPLGSFYPDGVAVSAAGHRSTLVDVEPAPRGRSRFEDRRQRPKLGR